ncbi:MAG: glycosyltransferase family 39 protein [Planctomycetaceae bacterium]|nr:glycosyltransferase family 39 protein [Planctomycetaceae bacterium]
MSDRVRDLLLVGMVASVVFLCQLGAPRLWDRDEPRNAGCAAEMLQRGDWVTPVFNAELRAHKPVLTYWAMMLCYSVFGVNEFAARLPAALCGIGTVLLTYLMGSRLFSRQAGLWGAIALATTVMFTVESRAATHDGVLIFTSTLALAIYALSTLPSQGRLFPRWPVAAAMYAVMGLAVLAKGPVGLVLPTAVIGMFLLLLRRLPESTLGADRWWRPLWDIVRAFEPRHFLSTCWLMRPITAITMASLVALPWYLWVHQRTGGAWTHGFFVEHNLHRATSAMEGHDGGVLYYPIMLIIGFFPWSIFWMPTLGYAGQATRRPGPMQEGHLFAYCWLGVYVGLFSIARTKLPHYITPCYPGVALLVGAFLGRWGTGEIQLSRLWPRLAFGSLIVVGATTLIVVPIISQQLVPGEQLLGLIGLLLVVAGIAALMFVQQGRISRGLQVTGAMAVCFILSVFSLAAVRIDQHRELSALMAIANVEASDSELCTFAVLEPSWVFYAGHPIPEHGTIESALRHWEKRSSSGVPICMITTPQQFERLRQHLPADTYTVHTLDRFLQPEPLVVLASQPNVMAAPGPAGQVIQASLESPQVK